MKTTAFAEVKEELKGSQQWLVEQIHKGLSEEQLANLIANTREVLEENVWNLTFANNTQQNNALKLVREFGYKEVEANCEKAVAKRILSHAGMLCDG